MDTVTCNKSLSVGAFNRLKFGPYVLSHFSKFLMSYRDSEAAKPSKTRLSEESIRDQAAETQTVAETSKHDYDAADDQIDQSRSSVQNPRYLYNEESDLWYDSVTGSYSRYDDRTKTYMPVRVIEYQDDDVADSGEPDSSATLRLVVQGSKLLPAGHIVLVDASGLTVGRDKSWDKRLRLAEMAVSKFHCQIYYDPGNVGVGDSDNSNDKEGFRIVDVGSTNGTYLNGERLSESKKSSVPRHLSHLDLVQIGSTILQVHLHRNEWPCKQCQTTNDNVIDVAKMNAPKEKQQQQQQQTTTTIKDLFRPTILDHKRELALLKKKYAAPMSPAMRPKFIDRRRWKNDGGGSIVDDHERDARYHDQKYKSFSSRLDSLQHSPQPLDAIKTTATPVGGIGDKLLRKMGWKEGQSLGRTGTDGILEPISPTQRGDRRGLGGEAGASWKKESPYQRINITTRERYNSSSTQN